jgi:DNA-binding NarL/FixJ family response regulator
MTSDTPVLRVHRLSDIDLGAAASPASANEIVAVHTMQDATRVLQLLLSGTDVEALIHLSPVESAQFLRDAEAIANVIHTQPSGNSPVNLTQDQIDLLDLIASGLKVQDAGRRLGWSPRTTRRRLADARHKLGVATTAEAVARLTIKRTDVKTER